MPHKISAKVLIVAILALGLAGCASSEEATTANHTTPQPTLSRGHAEAVFRRTVNDVAKGGLVKVGRLGTVETTCEPEKGHWGCTGWFVGETDEYCVSVGAPVSNTGKVGKEHYGKLPLGEPGGSECKL
jgi:hypothetical protein